MGEDGSERGYKIMRCVENNVGAVRVGKKRGLKSKWAEDTYVDLVLGWR